MRSQPQKPPSLPSSLAYPVAASQGLPDKGFLTFGDWRKALSGATTIERLPPSLPLRFDARFHRAAPMPPLAVRFPTLLPLNAPSLPPLF